MWIPQRLRDRVGRLATIGAAVLVFVMQAVPTLFPRLFGMEKAGGTAGLLALTLLALSLLDRFRPTRWFLLGTLPLVWVFGAPIGPSDLRRVLLFMVCCATLAWVLLNSGPVREYFQPGRSWAERFFSRRAAQGAEVVPRDTARAWDDPDPERELEPVGGGSREPAPSWWVNP